MNTSLETTLNNFYYVCHIYFYLQTQTQNKNTKQKQKQKQQQCFQKWENENESNIKVQKLNLPITVYFDHLFWLYGDISRSGIIIRYSKYIM